MIATKTDYIIEHGGKMMLKFDSLNHDIQAMFQQHTVQFGVIIYLMNHIKDVLDDFQKNQDAKVVQAQPAVYHPEVVESVFSKPSAKEVHRH
jgi:hypothetical protein